MRARALDRVIIFGYYQVPDLYLRSGPRVALGQVRHPDDDAEVLHDRQRPRRSGWRGRSPRGGTKDVARLNRNGARMTRCSRTSRKRLLLMIPTLLGVLTVTFVIIQFVPGGPVEQLIAEMRAPAGGGDAGGYTARRRDLDAKQIEDLKKLYGFDKPPLERYVDMLKSFAHFDLGKSFLRNKDVWQLIKEKLPVSISLGLWTFLLSYLISIPLGVAKAVREGSRFDTLTTLSCWSATRSRASCSACC